MEGLSGEELSCVSLVRNTEHFENPLRACMSYGCQSITILLSHSVVAYLRVTIYYEAKARE